MSTSKQTETCAVEMHLELPVAARRVWEFLEMTPTWHPLVKEAGQRGCQRSYTLVNGEELVHEHMPLPQGILGYHYRLRCPLPLRNYEAQVRIDDTAVGCVVSWRSTFDAHGVSAEEAVRLVKLVYQAGFDTLLKHFSKPDSIALTPPAKVPRRPPS